MTELQIQKDLEGKTDGQTEFKIAGSKKVKPRPYPETKKGGLDKYGI